MESLTLEQINEQLDKASKSYQAYLDKDKNQEIVRQLKLWVKEIGEDPKVRTTKAAGWVINTVNEILECDYD